MDAPRYLVICEDPCPSCKGEGMVSNEIYQDLAKWRRQWKREHPFPTAAEQLAAEDRWMNAKGFASGNWPPEEWECDDCNGTGRRRREVELQEALNAYRQ